MELQNNETNRGGTMNILQLMAHPEYNNQKRAANRLADVGLKTLQEKLNGRGTIEVLNVYDPNNFIPQITADTLNFTNPKEMTTERLKKHEAQYKLIRQWKSADYIYIYMPLHNWNVPAKFKDYLDNILTAGETFKYTESGSVGLMSDETSKVTFILTSGSEYETNYRYVNLDIAPQYMRGVLHMMGINQMKLIRAQGLDMSTNDKEEIMKSAEKELVDYINSQSF
ncbi:flavodoxin family protein [Robertmurraya kyonggiensis]|uniref:FMN dependent NADH:quinone oxidoreductase n=2 Tax=Robertmurraya kyonggiensis TaxID=1037680 RepID=A0A4U1D3L1_9BACI|nr:flavodoxin family protein [Robertmurraya kyonggiensis]